MISLGLQLKLENFVKWPILYATGHDLRLLLCVQPVSQNLENLNNSLSSRESGEPRVSTTRGPVFKGMTKDDIQKTC